MAFIPVEMEYVYLCEKTNEYRKIRVTYQIMEKMGLVTLYPEIEMTLSEIHGVICSFEDDVLQKMQINPVSDCIVKLFFEGRTYKVDLVPSHKVRGLLAL